MSTGPRVKQRVADWCSTQPGRDALAHRPLGGDSYVPNDFGGDDSVIDLTAIAGSDGNTELAKPKRTRKRAASKETQ